METIPRHGPLVCSKCFPVNQPVVESNGWRLVNDPGLWGARDPLVLVLGQSKGNTQLRVQRGGEFDRVAFAGLRERLADVLAVIGIELNRENLDRHFSHAEADVAFASVVRCSLSDPNGKTSGSPIIAAMDDSVAENWITECMRTWLLQPTPRLRVVVMLGITPAYVKGIMRKLKELHYGTFEQLDVLVARAVGVLWVFAQHPSRISENHYRRWISMAPYSARDAVHKYVKTALHI